MTSRRTDAGCLAEENIGLRERAAALREECERLAQRAEHYRDLYENSPDMYAVFNSGSTRLVECNETLARFLGYPRDDLIGRSLFSLHAQQDQGRIFDHFLRFLREGEIEDARVRIQHADGRRMPVSVSIAGTRDESGALVEGRVVMRDVTDVAGTEEALEQSEGRFRTLAETMGLVPWELDVDTIEGPALPVAGESRDDRLRRWSLVTRASWIGPQIEGVLGYAPELYIKPGFWFQRVHPGDRDRLLTGYAALVAAGESYEINYRIIAADGRVVSILDSVSIVRSADGGIRLIGVMADVTEREQAAAEQARLMKDLDHRVKDALSTVRAVAERTQTMCASMDEFRLTFGRRLRTLAHVHDALSARRWKGMSVRELVDTVLVSGDDAGRVSVGGPEVWLPIAATRVLGLALGELATSTAAAPASLTWQRFDDDGGASVRLQWRQSGPAAWRAVERWGLDRYLIEDGLAYELDARVALRLDVSGVTCDIDIPLAASTPGERDAGGDVRQ